MRGRKAGFWSPIEDEHLIRNLDKLSLKQLSIDLGKSSNALRTRIEEFGLKKATPKLPKVKRVCENVLCGDTFEASRYEVEERGRGIFCCVKCSSLASRIDVPDAKTLRFDYESGLSTNAIAEKYEISKGTVYNLFKAHGIETRSFVEANHNAQKMGKVMGNKNYHAGYREDLGVTVRSGWESSVLRWLNYRGIEWEYEPTRFVFPTKKNGAKSYLPDIWLPEYEGGRFVEVKGRLLSSDRTRIKRFKKFYPEEFEKLMAIPGAPTHEAALFFEEMEIPIFAYYNDLNREFKNVIEHWGE